MEETARVVEGYLEERGGRWLAETVELVDMSGPETHIGRARAIEFLRQFEAPTPARSRIADVKLTVADGRATAEWVVRRRLEAQAPHDGSEGEQAIHLAAVYEVEAGEIVAVRLYQARRFERSL